MTTTDTADSELTDADRVSVWLAGVDGVAAVRRALRQLQLPEAFDSDLVLKTLHAAERMVWRGEAIESIPGWTKRTLRLRAIDLFKSPRGRRAPLDDGTLDEWSSHSDAAQPDPGDVVDLLVQMESDDIRRHIGDRFVEPHPWRVSATLTYLSVALDGCTPGPSCPAPLGGADELDAAHWAGLFYAEQHHCFATSGAQETAAIRQRRKRRIDDVRRVLVDTYRQAQGGADRG